MTKLSHLMLNFIKVIFFIIIGYLLLLSMFSTSYLSTIGKEFGEFTYYRSDSPIWHLFMLGILVVVFFLIRKLEISKKLGFARLKKIQKFIPVIVFVILFVWIAVTLLLPGADQYFCVDSALAFWNHDYSAMQSGGYLDIYPNQIGLVLLEMPLVGIFGRSASLVFEVFNIVCLLLIYWFTKQITELAFGDKKTAKYAYYFMMLYLPLSFYVIFVYGTIPGMAASMGGFWLLLRYLEKNRVRDLILAVFLLTLANVLKNNYLIAILAGIAILFMDFIDQKRWISLAGIVLLLVLYVGSGWAVNATAKAVTGMEPGTGIPKQAWLAMGLQESPDRAEGWYNGYNWLAYEESGYNTELTKEASNASIAKSLELFKEKPGYAMHFFGRKIASQWNNPTFQCFWIYLSRQTKSPIIDTTLKLARGNNRWLVSIFNIMQTWILAGTLFYLIYNWKKIGVQQVLIPVCFIGGFLFHFIWEAKAQYTLPYFVLLFPLAVAGLQAFIKDVDKAVKEKKWKCTACGIILTLAVISAVIAIPTYASKSMFTIEQNSEMYNTMDWN